MKELLPFKEGDIFPQIVTNLIHCFLRIIRLDKWKDSPLDNREKVLKHSKAY